MITDEYGLKARQMELLDMLKEVNSLLSENNIQYSLCGGTLLGAIRHNGFIPWDDDIDIMVDRNNHNKIINLFRKKHVIEGTNGTEYVLNRYLWVYRIQKNGDKREKLSAATVDLLVMDNCPNNVIVRKCKVLAIKILQGMMHEKVSFSDHSLFYDICLAVTFLFGHLFSDSFKYKMYTAVSCIGNNKPSDFLTGYNDLFKLLGLRYKNTLFNNIVLHVFEDTKLPITSEYDSYLTTQYGDYMTPPDMDQRKPIHIEY